jgi:hypothetical protein
MVQKSKGKEFLFAIGILMQFMMQVKLNPTGAIGSFAVMCEAIGSWHVSDRL